MNLPAVASVVQLVGTAISNAKNARDLAKDSSDHQLKNAISDLYDALVDVKDRALELDEENRRLKQEIAQREDIEGPSGSFGYFFTKSRPEHPLCPKCLQSQTRNVVFLGPRAGLSQSAKPESIPILDSRYLRWHSYS